jgi:hypothetical protein
MPNRTLELFEVADNEALLASIPTHLREAARLSLNEVHPPFTAPRVRYCPSPRALVPLVAQ